MSVRDLIKRLIIIILLTTAFMLLSGCSDPLSAARKAAADIYYSYGAWDMIRFGRYEQNNDASDGPEEIEWLVLEKKDGRALVISRYGLECLPYHDECDAVTWETCTLRTWLNGTFIESAFSEDERAMILLTEVPAEDNSTFYTAAGNSTMDMVFLLSIGEVRKYFPAQISRKCVPTEYADRAGVFTAEDYSGAGAEYDGYDDGYYQNGQATCWWWLRTPGAFPELAAGVYHGGRIIWSGSDVSAGDLAVRPVMWIDLGTDETE